jgi:hypothetical protein
LVGGHDFPACIRLVALVKIIPKLDVGVVGQGPGATVQLINFANVERYGILTKPLVFRRWLFNVSGFATFLPPMMLSPTSRNPSKLNKSSSESPNASSSNPRARLQKCKRMACSSSWRQLTLNQLYSLS